jgi:hypothetical protein
MAEQNRKLIRAKILATKLDRLWYEINLSFIDAGVGQISA